MTSVATPPRAKAPLRHAPAVGTVGATTPLGATVTAEGVNFSVFSKNATRMELLLFDHVDDEEPMEIVTLDPVANRTYHYWHVFVAGLKAGQVYGFRAHGPFEPSRGVLFDSDKVLLDPYGRAVVVPASYSRTAAHEKGDNAVAAMKSVVVDPGAYDWEGDTPLRRSSSQTIVYEMHVRGFTKHPSSGLPRAHARDVCGVIEKIPYLQELGITAVELLPVFQFDAAIARRARSTTGATRRLVLRAAPGVQLAHDPLGAGRRVPRHGQGAAPRRHRGDSRRRLQPHAEGDHDGPTLCFRGSTTRLLHPRTAASRYADYSGCGNTLNAEPPDRPPLIVDSLRYWVQEMHVDGFRSTWRPILSRDPTGAAAEPAVLWDIESDPALAGTKLIAEAWDAAGCTRSAASSATLEGMERPLPRRRPRFFRGEPARSAAGDRLLGSPESTAQAARGGAERQLRDLPRRLHAERLVSYDRKHNEANGEDNRDGADDNRSWNCGVEGPTDDPASSAAQSSGQELPDVTLLSLGVPMILMGDEVRRTQRGNNNAYCHDDETSWFDWTLLEEHADVHASRSCCWPVASCGPRPPSSSASV
jgi:glycogen operon protein